MVLEEMAKFCENAQAAPAVTVPFSDRISVCIVDIFFQVYSWALVEPIMKFLFETRQLFLMKQTINC